MKTGYPVLEVIQLNHPNAHTTSFAILDCYCSPPPETVQLNLMVDIMTEVACRISGGGRSGGTDSENLQHWLLRFREASIDLKVVFAYFT